MNDRGKHPPTVSIGLAVYNGEQYLTEAIDSILNQTYTDFELILSDNASSDRTEEICRAYAASDPRIRYHRNPENIGGANNENFTFTLARGKYFRWAADDDICAPRLLEKCVAVLEEHPEVVLCYSMITEIDENGVPYKTMALNRGLAERPSERFGNLLQKDHMCETTYGLIRSSVMRRTRLQQNYTDSDRTLLAELALYGPFYEIPESLFFKRYHSGMSTQVYAEYRDRMGWFDPTLSAHHATMPYWLRFTDLLHTVQRVPIGWQEKAACYLLLSRFLPHFAKNIPQDFYFALKERLMPSAFESPITHTMTTAAGERERV